MLPSISGGTFTVYSVDAKYECLFIGIREFGADICG